MQQQAPLVPMRLAQAFRDLECYLGPQVGQVPSLVQVDQVPSCLVGQVCVPPEGQVVFCPVGQVAHPSPLQVPLMLPGLRVPMVVGQGGWHLQ